MQREWTLEFTSHLTADASRVWDHASTMRGVNAELMPLLRMTCPDEDADLAEAPTGRFLFNSWLLAGGVVPVDRHRLRLTRVEPGRGFVEDSVSWSQRAWHHERTVEEAPGGCTVTDRLVFTPRVAAAGPLIARFIDRLFRHRRARLRERFGGVGPVAR